MPNADYYLPEGVELTVKLSKKEAGKLGGIKSSVTSKQLAEDRRNKFNLNPKLCKRCGLPLNYKKRHDSFCSRSCSATFNNILSCRSVTSECKCLGCDSPILGGVYCSISCQQKYARSRRIESWLSSGDLGLKSDSFPRWAKNFILARQNNSCNKCGLFEWLGLPITLEIEHKDGNSQNNAESNLECLCPNCHSQTPTYKAKNIGNGRSKRRTRYSEGKSY